MEYVIETATWADLPRILEIYAYARAFMAKTGNPNQWGTTHPPREQLEEDIARKRLYVVKGNGQIQGVFYFCVEEDPTYAVIHEGAWQENTPYGVIHRIASGGSGGIVKAAVEFALTQIAHLRIDTHEDNRVMQRTVEKAGFTRRGIIYIADGTPRIAYDLIKKS